MKKYTFFIILPVVMAMQGCSLNDPETTAMVEDFPFRLQMDEEGADLPDAEDYGISISFADYLGDLPSSEIILEYSLEGENDFSNVSIDEIIYEYETDDCVFIRSVSFNEQTITIPVDPDLGTVPEEIEVVLSFNIPMESAEEGSIAFELTALQSTSNVVLNDVTSFEYEVLENDVAGEWVLEIASEEEFALFRDAFGPLSAELMELSFQDISGEVSFEFEFEEATISIELAETEIVTECEDGETESEEENLVIEIEADYEAEEGELVLEGSYFTEDGEELDFIYEMSYEAVGPEALLLILNRLIDEDNFREGESLYEGNISLELMKD